MKKEDISQVIGNINVSHIAEAENYIAPAKMKIRSKSFLIKAFVAACLITCLIAGAVVYATQDVHKMPPSISFEDGTKVDIAENVPFKDIPETAPKSIRTEKDYIKIGMTHAEAEAALGFDILKYDGITTDRLTYDTLLNNDGTIGRISLWWPYFLEINEDKGITLSISILNKGADYGYIDAFMQGIDAAGGKKLENTVKIESLGVDAVVYTDRSSEDKLAITFIYDNVYYEFAGYNCTQSEMLSILEQLK